MPALPTVGGSSGTWGTELNTWLLTAHNADGTLKDVGQTTIVPDSGVTIRSPGGKKLRG